MEDETSCTSGKGGLTGPNKESERGEGVQAQKKRLNKERDKTNTHFKKRGLTARCKSKISRQHSTFK